MINELVNVTMAELETERHKWARQVIPGKWIPGVTMPFCIALDNYIYFTKLVDRKIFNIK